MSEPEARQRLASLTNRQVAVLDLLVMHKTSKQIARELGISVHTVDQRIKAARQKLGANDRATLARTYTKLKSIYGESVYGSLEVDPQTESSAQDAGDQPEDPVFGLEAFDLRFGKFGRL